MKVFFWQSKLIAKESGNFSPTDCKTFPTDCTLKILGCITPTFSVVTPWISIFWWRLTKCHLGSPEIKRLKPCKHDCLRRETYMNLIVGVWMAHIKLMTPIDLVEVEGHSGSPEVKILQPCKHDIPGRKSSINLIIDVWVSRMKLKILLEFGGGQTSFGVIRCQIVTTL